MKTLLALAVVVLASVAAKAEVQVPYGQWTSLPHCGGETRLSCPDVSNARINNQCKLEFRNVACQNAKLYVDYSFHPKTETYEHTIQNTFFVDNSKINHWSLNFRVFLDGDSNGDYEQITYQFNY